MRSLSSTLLAAQRSTSGRPYVKAVVGDYWGDRMRLRFTRFYIGGENQGYAAAVVAADGSPVRARVDVGTSRLFVSRVTSPDQGSSYSSWTDLGLVGSPEAVALSLTPPNSALVL